MDRTNSRIARRAVSAFALLALVVPAGGCDDESHGWSGIKVMSQNVYYGFDVGPLLAAQSPGEIPVLAAQAFQQILLTSFAERAEAMADKIARERPHLIALQEVALFRIQSPGDAVAGGAVPAETVLFDHLEILKAALAARGLDYQVAGRVQNVDVELPMIVGVDPLAFDDIRLTDFDVVLARADVAVSNVVAANYQARAPVPSLGLEIPRGYVALDADLGQNRVCRFATTHLEDSPFEDVQLLQAQELAASLAGESKPVVLVGDFNSPAPAGGTYAFLGSQGYVDLWTRNLRQGEGEGLTWGHEPGLRNETVSLSVRIDLVLVRPASDRGRRVLRAPVFAEVWGDELDERTASGLWPSDHAGVIAEFSLPAAGSR